MSCLHDHHACIIPLTLQFHVVPVSPRPREACVLSVTDRQTRTVYKISNHCRTETHRAHCKARQLTSHSMCPNSRQDASNTSCTHSARDGNDAAVMQSILRGIHAYAMTACGTTSSHALVCFASRAHAKMHPALPRPDCTDHVQTSD